MGYTKYIALEGDYSPKAMAARSNPESARTNGTMVFPGIQHGIGGTHSPSEVTLEHITNMPKDSVKLFVSNIPSRHSQANGSGTGWEQPGSGTPGPGSRAGRGPWRGTGG